MISSSNRGNANQAEKPDTFRLNLASQAVKPLPAISGLSKIVDQGEGIVMPMESTRDPRRVLTEDKHFTLRPKPLERWIWERKIPPTAERIFWVHWEEGMRRRDWCSELALSASLRTLTRIHCWTHEARWARTITRFCASTPLPAAGIRNRAITTGTAHLQCCRGWG